MVTRLQGIWSPGGNVPAGEYRCAHCNNVVASAVGYLHQLPGQTTRYDVVIRICPFCNQPTYFRTGEQMPGVAFGQPVQSLPPDIDSLYSQARLCTSAGAYTPAVLACRKILMHIGVAQGAKDGGSFIEYVEYLAAKGYVPPNGKDWVDHIRTKANEANHEIVLMSREDAEELLSFLEMLLKFIYEFPSRVPKKPVSAAASTTP